jgi:hypothetical protein
MAFILFELLLLSLINSNPKSPKDFIWENRILIIQSSEFDIDWFDENLKKDLKARKLLVFQFEKVTLVNTNCEDEVEENKFLEKLSNERSKSAQWVLIGLDGGIKNTGSKHPVPSEIFRIIDAMPMRQSEIRSGNK